MARRLTLPTGTPGSLTVQAVQMEATWTWPGMESGATLPTTGSSRWRASAQRPRRGRPQTHGAPRGGRGRPEAGGSAQRRQGRPEAGGGAQRRQGRCVLASVKRKALRHRRFGSQRSSARNVFTDGDCTLENRLIYTAKTNDIYSFALYYYCIRYYYLLLYIVSS